MLGNPYDTHTLTITLEGDNYLQNLPSLGITRNDAFLMTRNGGVLSLNGSAETSWTQLDATASVGASSITLKEAVTWDVGNEIVIASTTFDMNEAETRVVTSISGDQKTLGLDAPLTYSHNGELQYYDNGERQQYTDATFYSRRFRRIHSAGNRADGKSICILNRRCRHQPRRSR